MLGLLSGFLSRTGLVCVSLVLLVVLLPILPNKTSVAIGHVIRAATAVDCRVCRVEGQFAFDSGCFFCVSHDRGKANSNKAQEKGGVGVVVIVILGCSQAYRGLSHSYVARGFADKKGFSNDAGGIARDGFQWTTAHLLIPLRKLMKLAPAMSFPSECMSCSSRHLFSDFGRGVT